MPGLFQFYPIQWNSDGDAAINNEQSSSLIHQSKDGDGVLGESDPFVYPQRQARDVGWWWALMASFVGMVICACVLQFYRSWDLDTLISKKALYNPANCPLPSHPARPGRRTLLGGAEDILGFESLLMHKIWWLLLGLVGLLAASIVIGTVVLRVFESKPEGTIKFVAIGQLALPLCAAAYLFGVGHTWLAVVLLVVGIINVVCASIWRPKLPLLARLISVACSVVADNPNLFWVSLLTQVGLAYTSMPFVYAIFIANRVGSLIHNPAALPPDTSSVCRHILTKQPTACCALQPSVWGVLFQLVAHLLLLWMLSFIVEAQTYVISGTVCQWYFAPVSATSCRGNVSRSGKHLRSSLGTVALGSLALFWVRFLRTFTYINDRRLTWKNPLSYVCGVFFCFYFCISCFITPCIERVTKYATHRAAISGYGFHHSNTVMHNTLRRSGLNHIGMGWVPPFILRFSSLTLAITAAVLAAASSYPARASFLESMVVAALKADVVLASVLVALSLVSPLLLGIIDSLYVCFALDREQQTCSKNIVHDIFTHVPSIGPIWDDAPTVASGIALGVPATRDEAGASGPQYSAPTTQHV